MSLKAYDASREYRRVLHLSSLLKPGTIKVLKRFHRRGLRRRMQRMLRAHAGTD